ncbi:hypothetical protein EDB86DRAFT_3105112 [Lactarius hatsudake]|nr:hypothetical protein EDB86DRAFT_3105112 [Lactarius hatsudake]
MTLRLSCHNPNHQSLTIDPISSFLLRISPIPSASSPMLAPPLANAQHLKPATPILPGISAPALGPGPTHLTRSEHDASYTRNTRRAPAVPPAERRAPTFPETSAALLFAAVGSLATTELTLNTPLIRRRPTITPTIFADNRHRHNSVYGDGSDAIKSQDHDASDADAIDQWFENFHHYEVTLKEMAAASLDVNFKEELSAIEQWFKVLSEAERTAALYSLLQHSTQVQIRFFITVLQQMARTDPMTALLSTAVGGSMQGRMEAKLASINLKLPELKATMPDAANTMGNLSDAVAQQRAKLDTAGNASHRISTPALASSGERGTWGWGHLVHRVPTFLASPLGRAGSAFRSPHTDGGTAPGGLDGLSPAVGDSWANMVNTPLFPMFQKMSSNNSNDGQTVDLAAAKLNDLYGSSNVPRLDGPDKFRRPSKGHMHDSSSRSNNGVTNNGVYGDDGDLIQGHHARGVGRVQSSSSRGLRNGGGGTWSGGQSPALSNSSGRFGGSDDGSNAMTVAHQQAALAGLGMSVGGFNLGLGSPGLTGMPNGLNMAQLAQLNGMNGMNLFNMNMNMLNLAAGIAAAGGGFGQPGLGVGAGLGTFGGMQGGISSNGLHGGSGRSGGRSPGLGGGGSGSGRGGSAGNGGAKKDDEDFEPSVLNDVAGWLRTLRLHKYTPNFEGMTWKEMVVMDEQALEAQGVAALGARRKMLKTFEVDRKKMGIDDPTAPPPPPSGESALGAPGSSGGSAGSGGGLSA